MILNEFFNLPQVFEKDMNEFDASGYDRYSIYMDDYDLKEKFSDLDDAVEAIEAYKRDDPKSRYADYNVRDLDGKVVWRNDAWQDVPKPGKIQFLPRNDQGVAEGIRTESAELAKQYGWAYNQGEYGASMTHPKYGRISLSSPVTSRRGDTAVEREWTHNNASGIGDRSLAQHLQSLKEQGMAEGWKDKVAGVALAGSMALGAAGANARVMPGDDPNINRLTGKPITTQQATDNAPAKAEAPKGFSKEYLQKAADPNRFGRYMISVEKAQELLNNMQEGVAEAKDDYVPPKEANYDDKYQAMVRRVGEKARAQEKAKQQPPKAPVRENRLALLKQIIQS